MFRSIVAGILAIVVLISTVGFTIKRHSCLTMAITKTYLIESPLGCCTHKKEKKKGCHQAEQVNKKCCEFSSEHHVLEVDKNTASRMNLVIPVFANAISLIDLPFLIPAEIETDSFTKGREPPERSCRGILLQSRILRI